MPSTSIPSNSTTNKVPCSVWRQPSSVPRVCAATGQRKATPTALSSGVRSVVASQTCIVVPSSPRTPMSATSTLSPLVIPQPHSVDSSLASAKKTQWNGSTLRALRPWDALDARLLAAISRGEFHLRGFRNRELRALLFPKTSDDPLETRRLSGRVTRLIRILRAHRLVKKVPKTFRYRLTKRGQQLCSALLTANSLSLDKLHAAAA